MGLALSAQLSAEPTKVFLAGDSTMAEKLPEKRPETGWGEMLGDWFNPAEVQIENHAKNGRSTRTFIEEGRWQTLLSMVNPGDYVFIQFGHNDQSKRKTDRYTPPEDFQINLKRFVSDVRVRQATPILLTPVARRRFDDQGQFYDSHGIYPDLTREVAAATDTQLIDQHLLSQDLIQSYGADQSKELFLWLAPGDSPNYPDGIEDNTHFNPNGAREMAALVVQSLGKTAPGLADLLKNPPFKAESDK